MRRPTSSMGSSTDFSKQVSRKDHKRKRHVRDSRENRPGKSSSSREQAHVARHALAYEQSADAGVDFIRQMVDGETLQYFAEISTLLGRSEMTDPDDRATLCANALEETQGRELGLACDKSCSRVLEMLVLSCDAIQVASFLHRISPVFGFIANDASGSHVAEALMKSAAAALHNYDGDSAWHRTLEQALAAICQVVGGRAEDMMSNCYGSHVLRSLLFLLSGALLDSSLDMTRGKLSTGLAGRLFHAPNNVGDVSEAKKIHFPNLLYSLVDTLLQGAKKNISRLRQDPFAGPVLQAILKILKGNAVAVTKAIRSILNCDSEILGKEGKILGHVPSESLKQMIFDKTSSHLVEVMLEVATDSVYMEIFQQIFRHNLLEFSLHHVANFVTQALITLARCKEQVNMLLGELGPSFLKLMKEGRSGVIASILIACRKYHTCEQEASRLLAQAINPESTAPGCLVPRVLFLENYGRCDVAAEWKPRFGKKMSVLGCVILQTIFSYSEECSQQFWLSLAAMDPDDILATVKDPGGCHVVESFLSGTVPLKHKNRVISKLKGHFADLASHMLTSFTVDKCFSVGNIRLKEEIASELATVQADLSKTKHGPHLIKKCDCMGYSRQPDRWRQRMTAKQSTFKDFSDIFSADNKFEMTNITNDTNFSESPDLIKPQKTGIREESEEIVGLKKKRKSQEFEETIAGMDSVKGLRSISHMGDDVRITENVSVVHKPRKKKKKKTHAM